MVITLNRAEKRLLEKAYFNPSHPGAFSSPVKLYKGLNKRISLGKIKKYLQSQESHTLLRQARRKFKRLKVVSPFIDYMWDLDTASMTFYVKGQKKFFPKKNRGYKYFLVAIDVFSRRLWTFPLKTLKADEMKKTIIELLKNKQPDFIRTDRGSEFANRQVNAILKRLDVGHILTLNETKANYAERVIRTVKDKMGKYLEKHETHEWIDILPKITKNYNHSYHRSIKKAPADVTKKDETALWKMNYEHLPKNKKQNKHPPKPKSVYKFDIGDYVRLVSYKGAFDKSAFSHKWTTELHIILDRELKQGLPRYRVVDYSKEEVLGFFYEQELQQVFLDGDPFFKIEKIIKKRKKRGRLEYFVKFKNWPKKYNTWVLNVRVL